MTERLTTLQAVKDWLAISSSDDDTALIRVIDAASRFALNYMNRDSLQGASYTQNFRGNGKNTQLLRNWPILSVDSVGIAGRLIPASTFGTGGLPSDGYMLSDDRNAPQSIDLFGFYFTYQAPCQVVYRAGFETTQSQLIPAPEGDPVPSYVMVTPTNMGQWSSNLGVTIDDVEATLSLENTPGAGEYYCDEWGNYTFNALDSGKACVISYCYVPWDVAFGVTQIVGEWWKRKERIGVSMKSLGGQETVQFTMADMNDAVRSMIQPYRNVVPV